MQCPTIMDKYDPEKKVDLFVDEWGAWYDGEEKKGVLYQQNTMRDAMVAGTTLNIFNNHADRVKMANIAQTVNVLQAVILTEEEKLLLTPTYHVMKMYAVHQNALLLPSTIDNAAFTVKEQSLPAISTSASKGKEGKVNISLVNIDLTKSYPISIDVRGLSVNKVSALLLASDTINDHNTFKEADKIKPSSFKEVSIKEGIVELKMPPFSVIVLELK